MQKSRVNGVTATAIVLAVCLMNAISGGIRSNYGLIRGDISLQSGVSYVSVSFILAVAQLSYGVMQPMFGVLAMRRTNALALSLGAALAAAGLLGIPLCGSTWSLLLCLGLLMPVGLAALSFGIIMGTITPLLGERRAAAVSGIVTASSGLGSIILAPVLRGLLDVGGLWSAILSLAIPTACLIPVALWLAHFETKPVAQVSSEDAPLRVILGEAVKSRAYRFLTLAFFTCGFHMAIIETHLYTQFTDYGFSDTIATLAFSVYGIATMLGSVVSGLLCSRVPMQYVLGCLYGSRVVWILGFLLLPKSMLTVYGYAALLGFTGSATVPPTSGLINRLFGTARLGTLFGLAFVFHQIGSFFSAWLGGVCVSATGGYTVLWLISAALGLVAAALSFRVKAA